jgi:phage tail protein X
MADILTARQGDTLDELLWRERGLGPEVLDAVLTANPGLADRGDVLPIGTTVTVPETATQIVTVSETVQLWS